MGAALVRSRRPVLVCGGLNMVTLSWLSGVLLILAFAIAIADVQGGPLQRRHLVLAGLAFILGIDGLAFVFCVWVLRMFQ